MRQRLGDLIAGQTTLETAAQVDIELIVVAHPGERGDGDQAPIARTEVGPPPEVVEDYVVRELRNFGAMAPKSSLTALARAASEPGAGRRGVTARSVALSIFRAVYTCS